MFFNSLLFWHFFCPPLFPTLSETLKKRVPNLKTPNSMTFLFTVLDGVCCFYANIKKIYFTTCRVLSFCRFQPFEFYHVSVLSLLSNHVFLPVRLRPLQTPFHVVKVTPKLLQRYKNTLVLYVRRKDPQTPPSWRYSSWSRNMRTTTFPGRENKCLSQRTSWTTKVFPSTWMDCRTFHTVPFVLI